ncbi:MAG: 2-C-methyl-D-erythritol 4-phosphate cytidylyltransferase [Candidatus Geothermincolia bacterium]
MRAEVIIAAAGAGRRLAPDAPQGKALLPLAGQPLIEYSLRLFEDCESIDAIHIAAAAGDLEELRALTRLRYPKVSSIIAGGGERQDSVRRALEMVGPGSAVLVHDAARPLADESLVDRVLDALNGADGADGADGAVPVIPISDTLKEVEGGWVVRTWDRGRCAAVQTPQGFRAGVLPDVHARALADGLVATDDAALLEHYGFHVAAVAGDRGNIKITFPEDLALARALLDRL